MDQPTVLQLVQTLGAALIAYLGVRFTGRRAHEAAKATRHSEDLKAAAEEWRELKEEYRTRLMAVEKRVGQTEEALVEERQHSRRQDGDMKRLRRQLTAWARWAENLSHNWPTIRQQPHPPAPPMDDYYHQHRQERTERHDD